MPQNSATDENHPVSRWRKFHFSGKVIICSVLFGLGLVLIGGLVFSIGINDNEEEELKENTNEIPTKAPSSIVGPIIMGIGGFIATVGVVMCLFETQVCRKRKGDASPLIDEQRRASDGKSADPTVIASTSKTHEIHRHKKSSSPRKSKGTKKYQSSKDRTIVKSQSSKSPPIAIGSSRNFLTSSESNFHTPPSSFAKDSVNLNSNSRDAENQTGTSLMKSFTSSGPSWNTSTEFRTPEASFKEMSSLETSVQTDDLESSSSTLNNPLVDSLLKIDIGFLTPVTPSEKISSEIKQEIGEQKSENNHLVQNSDETMSVLIQEEQANVSKIISNDKSVEAAHLIPKDKISEPNSLEESSTENSKNELLKKAMTDSSAYVVLQNDEMCEEKDSVDILFNNKTNKTANSSTIVVASVPESEKVDENVEKMNKNETKPSEQPDILRKADLEEAIGKFEHSNEQGDTIKEEYIDNLTFKDNSVESEEKNTISSTTQKRKTNNRDTNDIIIPETIFRHDAEVETSEFLSSKQAESVDDCSSDVASKNNEQNENFGSTNDNKLSTDVVSDDSEINSS